MHSSEEDQEMATGVVRRPGSRLKWDVFLSFRGEDTRHTIAAGIYEALKREVRLFRDDDALRRGEEIAPSLVEAIEDSAASIVVFSPRYADSHWCLEELAKLCDLRSSLSRPILPIFYMVDPSHVRKQDHHFAKDFEEHAKRFSEEKIQRWRRAMNLVGNLAGFVRKESIDTDGLIIELVVKWVFAELSNTPEKVGEFAVGLESRLKELMELLDVKSNSGVRVLGLHGMGGIGKTTLAKALYNKIVGNFEHRVFLSDVRERSSEQDGLVSLQGTLIKELFHSMPQLDDVNNGKDAIKERVQEKKILVVLDDVDDGNQIAALIGERRWYGEGSIIVITTRNEKTLSGYTMNQHYEVSCLNETEALKLFSYHALRKEKPADRLLELSKQIVSLTGHLPLALEVFGSLFYDKREEKEWWVLLEKLRKIRPKNLQDVLAVSFSSLDNEEKCVFLDIACLFLRMEITKDDVVDILKGCGFNAEAALSVLKQKSLIKISEEGSFWMHDQIRDMGRQIVLDESLDPAMRSRLWDRAEIMAIMKNMKGTISIQGIVLDFRKKFVRDPSADEIAMMNLQNKPGIRSVCDYLRKRFIKHHGEEKPETYESIGVVSFKTMTSLRLLQINHVKLEGTLKLLPPDLKWIQWKGCPLENLPRDFRAGQLAVLDLSESRIRRVWGSRSKGVPENLKVVNLRGCHSLEELPDFSKHKALEKINLERCSGLVKVHTSVGNLRTLLHLNLRNCSNLAEFTVDVSGLKHLENLILSGCSNLKELPENLGSMRCLKELLVDETAIMKLPESIYHLERLEKLSLKGCRSIEQLPIRIGDLRSLKELNVNDTALQDLPSNIGYLKNLQKLSLMRCKSLHMIPESIGQLVSLKELFLNGSAVKELPLCLGSLPCLTDLSAGECKFLKQLPNSIGGLNSLFQLKLDRTPITALPKEIGALHFVRRLEELRISQLSARVN